MHADQVSGPTPWMNQHANKASMLSLLQIFTAADIPIAWDEQDIAEQVDPRTNSFITRENLDSVLVRGRRFHAYKGSGEPLLISLRTAL